MKARENIQLEDNVSAIKSAFKTLQFKILAERDIYGFIVVIFATVFSSDRVDALSLFTTFVGLPNLGKKPSWKKLGWKLLGWEDNKSDAINIVLMPFSIIKNLLVIIFTLPANILRVFAEFLPLLASEACKRGEKFARQQYLTTKGVTAYRYHVLNRVAKFFHIAFESVYLIGRAITSPIESIRAAWNFDAFDEETLDKNIKDETTRGVVAYFFNGFVRCALVLLSAIITATAYSFLFPLVFKLIPLMGPEIVAFAVKVGNFLSPILASFSNSLVVNLAAALGFELTPALAGFAYATFLLSILAAPGKRLVNYIVEQWRTTEIKNETAVALRKVPSGLNINKRKIEFENKSYLISLGNSLARRSELRRKNAELTRDELEEDFSNSRTRYYVNGVETFKGHQLSIKVDFKKLLQKTDKEIVAVIENNFNKEGFKGISAYTTTEQLNQWMSADTKFQPEGTHYYFVESEDGNSVTLIERFQLNKVDDNKQSCPHFICETQFTICYDENNLICIKPVQHKNILIKPEIWPEEIISFYNIIDASDKTLDQVVHELDKENTRASELRNPLWETLLADIAPLFYRIYPADNYNQNRLDVIFNSTEFKSWPVKTKEWVVRSINQYRLHPITMIAAFLGLPNECELGVEPSWENIGWNMLGWDKSRSTTIRNIKYFLTPVTLIKNIIVFALTTVHSILRLFTELLPAALALEFERLAESALLQYEAEKNEAAFPYALLYGFASLLRWSFEGIYLLGRAITSPFDSAIAAWDFAFNFHKDENEHWAIYGLRVAAGIVLVLLSVSVSATVYAFLYPLLFNIIPVSGPTTFVAKAAAFFKQLGGGLLAVLELGAVVEAVLVPAAIGFGYLAFFGIILGAALKTTIHHFKEFIRGLDAWLAEDKVVKKVCEEDVNVEDKRQVNANIILNRPTNIPTSTDISQSTNESFHWKKYSKDKLSFTRTGNAVFAEKREEPEAIRLDANLESDESITLDFL